MDLVSLVDQRGQWPILSVQTLKICVFLCALSHYRERQHYNLTVSIQIIDKQHFRANDFIRTPYKNHFNVSFNDFLSFYCISCTGFCKKKFYPFHLKTKKPIQHTRGLQKAFLTIPVSTPKQFVQC